MVRSIRGGVPARVLVTNTKAGSVPVAVAAIFYNIGQEFLVFTFCESAAPTYFGPWYSQKSVAINMFLYI